VTVIYLFKHSIYFIGVYFFSGCQVMPTSKNEPEKFAAIFARHFARHLPTLEIDLHKIRGQIVSAKFKRIFQDFHRELAEEM
jgi:hypothetical protein